MLPDLVLAFDTSAAHCAAALLRSGQIAAVRIEPMAKGQAERLVPMLDELLAEAGVAWRDVGVIGVGTGPGNFTGVRIAVALARGLALGLKVPAVGVTSFEALGGEGRIVALPAPRGQVYVQRHEGAVLLEDAVPEGAVLLDEGNVDQLVTGIARQARLRAMSGVARPAPFYIRAADAAPASDPPPVILP